MHLLCNVLCGNIFRNMFFDVFDCPADRFRPFHVNTSLLKSSIRQAGKAVPTLSAGFCPVSLTGIRNILS